MEPYDTTYYAPFERLGSFSMRFDYRIARETAGPQNKRCTGAEEQTQCGTAVQ